MTVEEKMKPPAESTMNHPFIPGGSHEKRCGDGRRDIISKETNLGVVQTLLMFICWAWKEKKSHLNVLLVRKWHFIYGVFVV